MPSSSCEPSVIYSCSVAERDVQDSCFLSISAYRDESVTSVQKTG